MEEQNIPETVGEMIEFLKQFPKDCELCVIYSDDDTYEKIAQKMEIYEYTNIECVDITFK